MSSAATQRLVCLKKNNILKDKYILKIYPKVVVIKYQLKILIKCFK